MAEIGDLQVQITAAGEALRKALERAAEGLKWLAVAYWRGMSWQDKMRFAFRNPRAAWTMFKLARKQ